MLLLLFDLHLLFLLHLCSSQAQPREQPYPLHLSALFMYIWLNRAHICLCCLVVSSFIMKLFCTRIKTHYTFTLLVICNKRASPSAHMPYEYISLMCAYYLRYLFVLWIFFLVIYYLCSFFCHFYSSSSLLQWCVLFTHSSRV